MPGTRGRRRRAASAGSTSIPDEAIPPGDVLHWTGGQQNWNFMCADCHSTAVRKGYDPAAYRFTTTFSEVERRLRKLSWPGAGHLAWAQGDKTAAADKKGFASTAAKRPTPDWTPDPLTGSPAAGVSRPSATKSRPAACCHARRGQFAEGWQPGRPLADFYRPTFLTPDLFEDDGQMRDEVFNYASFQQSKMHAKGVVCSDCHDPHSGELKAAGSEVCAQCHLPAEVRGRRPHRPSRRPGPARLHRLPHAGAHLHGGRSSPRPQLPDSAAGPVRLARHAQRLQRLPQDKPAAWAAAAVERWHGPVRKGFQTYAPAFHAARMDDPDARASFSPSPAIGRRPRSPVRRRS